MRWRVMIARSGVNYWLSVCVIAVGSGVGRLYAGRACIDRVGSEA